MAQDWVVLTNLIKVAKPTPSFLTKIFMEVNKEFSPVPKVTLRNKDASIVAAPLRALYDNATTYNGSFTWDETSVNPPQIFEKLPVTEELLLSQISDPGIVVADEQSVIDNKMFVYAEAVSRLKTRVMNRMELMCGQILSDGEINYNDGTYTYNVTFVTPSDETVDPEDDLLMWLKNKIKTMKASGFAPKYIIVSPDIAAALLHNTYVEKLITKSGYALGSMDLRTEPYADVVINVPDLPAIVCYEALIGTERTFSDTGKVVFVDPRGIGTAFGAVANANLRPNMTPVRGDIFAFESMEPDGSAVNIYAISRPLPYVLNSNAVLSLNVTLSTT